MEEDEKIGCFYCNRICDDIIEYVQFKYCKFMKNEKCPSIYICHLCWNNVKILQKLLLNCPICSDDIL